MNICINILAWWTFLWIYVNMCMINEYIVFVCYDYEVDMIVVVKIYVLTILLGLL